MAIPTVGEIRQFHCSCLEKTRQETFRDNFGNNEKLAVDKGQMSTSWICKRVFFKKGQAGTDTWKYFWECTNCHKETEIGVWDSEGKNLGDGSQIADFEPTWVDSPLVTTIAIMAAIFLVVFGVYSWVAEHSIHGK